ncbi:MAG: HAD family hydrolase [Clostridium sp.]|uniref:HAD family hydrolase n=1 Tax=Clostridium sp. TaxID=1506 RepID=UPI00306D9570
MTKLIIFDLDGTLLHTDKTISPYTQGVLSKCKEQGIHIGCATARSEITAIKCMGIIKPDFIISSGGARVNYNGEIVYSSKLSVSTVKGIIQELRRYSKGQGEITIIAEEGKFCNYKDDSSKDLNFGQVIYLDFLEFEYPAYKVTAEFENEDDAKNIAGIYEECSSLSYSGEILRQFAHKDANKLMAIQKLIEYLNIDVNDVVAFGDDYNDIEMIKFCGKGIAMNNAITQVKNVADFITDSNDEDGVAKYIEKSILQY